MTIGRNRRCTPPLLSGQRMCEGVRCRGWWGWGSRAGTAYATRNGCGEAVASDEEASSVVGTKDTGARGPSVAEL